MTTRRAFLGTLAGGLLAAPLVTEAQPAGKVYRIGILGLAPKTLAMVGEEPQNRFVNALLRGLRELGYVYGKHFVTEPRGAEGRPESFPSLVADLVRLQVDTIVCVAAAVGVLKRATSTIPIVMPGSDDPVGERYVESLAHPGGNVTGLSFQAEFSIGRADREATGATHKEVAPAAAPVAVLWDRGSQYSWRAAEAAARERKWKLLSLEVRDTGELEGAFGQATRAQAVALLVVGSALLDPQVRQVVELAAKNRLPAMYRFPFQVEVGGLMSYGPDLVDMWRRAAVFVDKILKGAKPGDLPVEQPTKFELVINLKTAKALGLTILPALLGRADQVIQ